MTDESGRSLRLRCNKLQRICPQTLQALQVLMAQSFFRPPEASLLENLSKMKWSTREFLRFEESTRNSLAFTVFNLPNNGANITRPALALCSLRASQFWPSTDDIDIALTTTTSQRHWRGVPPGSLRDLVPTISHPMPRPATPRISSYYESHHSHLFSQMTWTNMRNIIWLSLNVREIRFSFLRTSHFANNSVYGHKKLHLEDLKWQHRFFDGNTNRLPTWSNTSAYSALNSG